ncbi:uncharacterized protein LOC108106083 isoform X2 [Drosophila eugracilis]|uniref:uncharacterized protein LOC108106083 isoform X2 n=1 Tax=Drosophila eugracilis TaxID=29029 RepID=UPI0007E67EBC|nr:uncharacterized protein LOC108106083 isoform X2 [Drosophila eugracilis]
MVRNSGAELELPVAGWNRGLSFDQMQAVDELREALDFDINVTRDCLLRLGVRPLVGNKQLLRIVQLSRGQSLAFLYFLFQEHYSSGKSCGKYTVNGQLLLSAIAYLDLPATIRALDEVLPLRGNRVSESNTPLEVQKKHSARQSVFGVESEKPSIAMPATLQVEDKVFSSKVTQTRTRSSGQPVRSAQPYFQKQPRPKSCYRSTRFLANYPHFQVQIPNEVGDAKDDDDRWFANYQFHPIQRTVKAFISHELCHLFDQIDDSLSNPDQEPRDLCEYHKGTRSQKRLSFLNEQRRRYLKMLDVEGNEKRLNRERIIHHLNRDVDEYLLKFGDKGWSPGVPAFRKTGCVACNELVHEWSQNEALWWGG